LYGAHDVDFPLLPVELQHVNHAASTNSGHSTRQNTPDPTIANAMLNQHPIDPIDQITERVEQLLLRYAQLQRTNAQLLEQVTALSHERDSLRSRLSAARARVDALIERLPETTDSVVNPFVDPAR
jgi:cell division protein ZapB